MSKEWYGGVVMDARRTVLLLDMLCGSRASYAPGPGVEVRWFLSILALSLASSKAALAAAGVCVAGSQQQGKASGEACDVSPGLACIPLAEFWGLKFMEAGMSPPKWIPTRTHGWEPSKPADNFGLPFWIWEIQRTPVVRTNR